MKRLFFTEIFFRAFLLLFFSSCGQQQVVKEENPVQEENVNIETNEENPSAEEYVNIETNEVFTTEETVELSNKMRVLILPFENRTDEPAYPNSKILNTILLNEFYAFLYIVPSFDVPEKTELTNLNSEFLNRKNIKSQDIYSNYQADIIIYGNYSLEGSKTDPAALIRLNIWNKASGKTVGFEYKTPIDADIFDTIDTMLSQIIKLILNEEIKIAYLNFGDFKIGNGSYSLLINNKPAAKITNDNFSLNLKILPNAIYSVKLRNLANNRNVLNTTVILKPGETTNISHAALGNIRCSIKNKAPGEDFQILMDGSKIPLDEVLSNLPAERKYQIKITDRKSNSYYDDTFFLSDGESKNLILPKNKMVFYNFTGKNSIPFSAYNRNSSVKITSFTNNIIDGKKSCSWDFRVAGGYAGIHFGIDYFYNKMDWSNMNTFKIWIYGTQTHIPYFIQLEDKENELYWYWLKDEWKGWKKISIPLDSFKFRPYQHKNAKINHKIDYPLMGMNFELNSIERNKSTGNFRLTIGKMFLTRE